MAKEEIRSAQDQHQADLEADAEELQDFFDEGFWDDMEIDVEALIVSTPSKAAG